MGLSSGTWKWEYQIRWVQEPHQPANEEVAQTSWNLSSRRSSWSWRISISAFLSSLQSGQSPVSPGGASSSTRWGHWRLPQPGWAGSPPACGWLCNSPFLWMCWEQLPFCFTLWSPSAQQLPKFNSGVACPQPPVGHCLLGITPIPPNKGPQIWINPLTSAWRVRKLSRTVPMPASFKPFGFADLCLTPERNTLACHR